MDGGQSTFDAGELTGFILEGPNQQYLTAYQLPGSDQFVVGSLLDSDGSDLSEDRLYEYVHEENLGEVLKALEGSERGWVAEGNPDAPYVYLFDDPMCGYCHEFYKMTREAVKQGELQLRHIMVGVVAANSEQAAAQILDAEDPVATLAAHHEKFMQGGLPSDATLSGEVHEQLKTNAALTHKAGGRGTPPLVYLDADDRVKMHPGVIEVNELLSLLGQG